MKWHEQIDKRIISELNILSGTLNMPELSEYESMHHFLVDVRNRVVQSRYLLMQAIKGLGGKQ